MTGGKSFWKLLERPFFLTLAFHSIIILPVLVRAPNIRVARVVLSEHD